MDAPALSHLGSAARALLAATVAREPRVYPQIGVALRATVASFSTAPAESALAIRQLLTDDEVRAHGHMQLRELGELIDDLLEHDLDLVLDVYRAAFSWRDTSEEMTPMRSGVLALSSTRRQDYDGARRALADAFPKLAQAAPAPAATVLAAAVLDYLAERQMTLSPGPTVDMMGRSVELIDDGSAYWDRPQRPRDPQVEMLIAWQAALVAQAGDGELLEQLADALVGVAPAPACLLSHLLAAGAEAPQTLGAALDDVLLQAPQLAASNLLVAYGDLLVARWPLLTTKRRQKLEQAILALPESFDAERPQVGEMRRDRLIALLDPGQLVGQAGQDLAARLRAEGHAEGNPPLVGPIETGFARVEDDDLLRMRGVDPQLGDNGRLLTLTRAVRDWHTARAQADVETRPLQELVEALRALSAALPELRAGGRVDAVLLDEAVGHLAQGALDLAERIDPDTPAEQLELVLLIARHASEHRLPDASQEDPAAFDSDMPMWSWPAPRVEAASIYLSLARYPELASPEVLDGLSKAIIDPFPAVRAQVAEYGWWVIRADADRVWDWATTASQTEEKSYVLAAWLVTISNLYVVDADRAVALAVAIRQHQLPTGPQRHLLDALAGLFAEWWMYDARLEGRVVLDELMRDLDAHINEVSEVAGRLRGAVSFDARADAAAVRGRGFALMAQLLDIARRRFDELLAQPPISEEVGRAVSHLLDTLCAGLYFSSGAYERGDDEADEVPDPARFYAEASSALDQAVHVKMPRAADYIVRTLTYFVDVDPRGVLARLREVLEAGEPWGLAGDSLTEGHLMPAVSHILAAHRDLLMRDSQARADLVAALSAFSRAGSPSARRILYGLDDMFR